MNRKRILIVIALAAMMAVPLAGVLVSEEGDSASVGNCLMIDTSRITSGGFDNRTSGHLDVTIINTSATDAEVRVYVTYQNSTEELASVKIDVPGNQEAVASLNFMIGSSGDKYLTVYGESETEGVEFLSGSYGTLNYANVSIHVNHSIWSNWATYVAIIIVVILVAVAAYLRGRSMPKREKTMTFTELERQERGRRAAPEAKTTTERRRYQSKRK